MYLASHLNWSMPKNYFEPWNQTDLGELPIIAINIGRIKAQLHIKCGKYCSLIYRHTTHIMKQIIQTKHNRLKIPAGRRQTSWLFTSVAGELNSGLP